MADIKHATQVYDGMFTLCLFYFLSLEAECGLKW